MASRQLLDLNKMDKSIPEEAMHKNRLQEFTQKYGLALPEYRIVNEGFSHAPKFRSIVLVNGKEFKSRLTYPHRKEAEQDVADLALKTITEDIKNEEYATLPDLVYSKSILIEYAVKKNLENPQYKTTTEGELHPVFASTLTFNGKSYTGQVGKSKKEAEQFVAFSAVQSLLESNPCFDLRQIIKSKIKISNNAPPVNHSARSHSHRSSIMKPGGSSKETVDTQPPDVNPGDKNKRKLDSVNLGSKKLPRKDESNPCFDLHQIIKSKVKNSKDAHHVNHSTRSQNHSSLITKLEGSSKETVDTPCPTAIPGDKNKRKLDNVNIGSKTLQGKMACYM